MVMTEMSFTEPAIVEHAYYLNWGFKRDLARLFADARKHLKGIEFDTIVCTGLSGLLVAPALWRELGVPHLAVVRKPEDQDNHSGKRVEGRIGARWLFVDDLVCSGSTRVRVRQAVDERASWNEHETAFVGTYVYGASGDPSAFYGPHDGTQP